MSQGLRSMTEIWSADYINIVSEVDSKYILGLFDSKVSFKEFEYKDAIFHYSFEEIQFCLKISQ